MSVSHLGQASFASHKHQQDWIPQSLHHGNRATQAARQHTSGLLLAHAHQILRYFDHPISSGITEGINSRTGLLTPMATTYTAMSATYTFASTPSTNQRLFSQEPDPRTNFPDEPVFLDTSVL